MTPAERAAFEAQMAKHQAPKPKPAPAPSAPAAPARPSSALEAYDRGAASFTPAPVAKTPWEMTPEQAEAAGFTEAAAAMRDRGGPNEFNGSPFRTEWGQQYANRLRTVPLQRSTGEFGMDVPGAEKRIAQLWFMEQARQRGLPPIQQMPPEQYKSLMAEAEDHARRKVAGITEVHEQQGNALAPLDVNKMVEDTRAGRNLPAPLYLTTPGLQALSAQEREAAFGWKANEAFDMNLMSPFLALARPGVIETQEDGRPVTSRESKLWWMFRLAPSTSIGSWLLDPELKATLGGEDGFGGRKHIEKIIRGYDISQEMPRIAETYDSMTPWESSYIEKTIAAALPVMAVTLAEPDAITVGTGLLAAPLVKGAKEWAIGVKVLEEIQKPAVEAWKAAHDAGKTAAEIGETTTRDTRALYDQIAAHTISDIATDAAGRLGAKGAELGVAADLGTGSLRGVGDLAAEASTRVADHVEGMEKLAAAAEEVSKKADTLRGRELGKVTREAVDSVREMQELERATIGTAMLRNATRELQAGDVVVSKVTGDAYKYVGRGGKQGRQILAVGQDGEQVVIQVKDAVKLGNPSKWPDSKKVLDDLMQLKQETAKAERMAKNVEDAAELEKLKPVDGSLAAYRDAKAAQADAAELRAAGTPAQTRRMANAAEELGHPEYADELRATLVRRAKQTENLEDLAFANVESAFSASKAKAAAALRKLADLKASGAYTDPKISKTLEKLNPIFDKLIEATSRKAVLERQAEAVANAESIFRKNLDKYAGSIDALALNLKKGVSEAGQFRDPVIAAFKGQVDGGAYYTKLVERYGQPAVDAVLKSPVGRTALTVFNSNYKLTPEILGDLSDAEKAMYSEAEAFRLAGQNPAKVALETIGQAKGAESYYAKGYQLAEGLRRNMDWVGASAVGRSPKAVRELVRRGFERFQMLEHDMGIAAKTGGIAGVREFLTTSRQFEGAVGNQDVMSLADKAVEYLRMIAGGDEAVWKEDQVVTALINAPLPSGRGTTTTQLLAAGALREALNKPGFNGEQLIRLVEHSITGLYANQLGKADNADIIFRFVARAVGFGASQHDTVWDIARLNGPGLGAEFANGLDWFTHPERLKLVTTDMDQVLRGMAAYGMPRYKQTRGAIESLFKARQLDNEVMKLADLEGQGVYIPRALWTALKEIPQNLAKEMVEFAQKPNLALSTLDRFSRLWRVSVVNGYIVPRAAYFVNNCLSDAVQAMTSVGLREGSRLGLQSLPSYVPFVGPRLQASLMKAAEKHTILSAIFDPHVQRVLEASAKDGVTTAEGFLSYRRVLSEAREDGCFDSIGTRDLMDIASRGQKRWDPLAVPGHIETSARFMETIQSRNRVALYLRQRMLGKTRQEARDMLSEALYDWTTGIAPHERATIGRLTVFWGYRRNMLRQLGAALTEGITSPDAHYGFRALTGQTKLGRTMKLGRLANEVPDMLYWTDPNASLDDPAQLHELGMRTAPWWVTSQPIFGNRKATPERVLWNSEVAGRDVTYETLMGPTVTTLDQLYTMNLFFQDAMATTVWLGEKAGLSPNMTMVQADELYEKNIQYFADMLAPGANEFMDNALQAMLLKEGRETSPKGVLIPRNQAVLLRRLGWEDFMSAHEDPNGQIRVDANAYGYLTQMLLAAPMVNDLANNWAIWADNPGYQESLGTGLLEALSSWAGLLKPQGHNPSKTYDYESEEKERRIKDALSAGRKNALTKEQLQNR